MFQSNIRLTAACAGFALLLSAGCAAGPEINSGPHVSGNTDVENIENKQQEAASAVRKNIAFLNCKNYAASMVGKQSIITPPGSVTAGGTASVLIQGWANNVERQKYVDQCMTAAGY